MSTLDTEALHAKPQGEPQVEPELELEPQVELEPELQVEPESELRAESELEYQGASEPQLQSEPRHQPTAPTSSVRLAGSARTSQQKAKEFMQFVMHPQDMQRMHTPQTAASICVSVIIPMWNNEDTIERTLVSIQAQTHTNFECIIVNDGSTDASAQVCSRFCKSDARFVMYTQNNSGVSAARNYGLARAHGTLVLFLDADDSYKPTTFHIAVETYIQAHWDVLVFGFDVVPKESWLSSIHALRTPHAAMYFKFSPALMFSQTTKPFVCRSAYARSFLLRAHARFHTALSLGEDMEWFFYVYPRSAKTQVISQHLYEYVMRDTSVVHSISAQSAQSEARYKKVMQHLDVIDVICADWYHKPWAAAERAAFASWACDFVLFDMLSLAPDARNRALVFLRDVLCAFTDTTPQTLADIADKDAILHHTLQLVCAAAEGTAQLTMQSITMFYVTRRGIVACVKRLACKLLGRSSYN